MSMDFERRDSEKPITEQEGVMFAAQPVWERRGRKRGAFGRKAAPVASASTIAPEPRSFAADRDEPMALDTPVEGPRVIADRPLGDGYVREDYVGADYAPAPASTLDNDTDGGLVAPIGATTRADRSRKSNGMAPAAIAASVVALGAIGAVGWYASRDNDGIPEIAPGQPTTTEMATAPLPPSDAPPAAPVASMAVNPPAAVAPPRQAVPTRAAPVRTAQAARTRPAVAAPSAADTAVNSSATLPAGPQAYSTLNPDATPPVTEAAPAPAEAPAAIPETPPIQATPPTNPAPETTATPPTS